MRRTRCLSLVLLVLATEAVPGAIARADGPPIAPPPRPQFPPTGAVAGWIESLNGADAAARTKALDGLIGLFAPPREALPGAIKLANAPDLGTRARAALLVWQLDPTTEPDWELFRAAVKSDDAAPGRRPSATSAASTPSAEPAPSRPCWRPPSTRTRRSRNLPSPNSRPRRCSTSTRW